MVGETAPQANDEQALWRLNERERPRTRMAQFIAYAGARTDAQVQDYDSLYQWSIRCPEQFWGSLWDFFEVLHSRSPSRILEQGDAMPGARWFRGARVSYARNLLRHNDERAALQFVAENGTRTTVSFKELGERVALLAAALVSAGVEPGDRVAGILSNTPDTVELMLASNAVGAIWSCCSPDFGVAAVLDRFTQIEPSVVFVQEAYYFKGRRFGLEDRYADLARGLPTVRAFIHIPFPGDPAHEAPLENWSSLRQFTESISAGAPDFVDTDFSDPLFILFSSGTTGRPKCIVHSVGGVLLQHLKELALHSDVGAQDVLFYYTTTGWMMWNWMLSGLALGTTLVLYEGSPFHPGPQTLFDWAERLHVTHFGVSARYLAAVEKAGLAPRKTHRLQAMRCILSTGSPLLPESFDFVYRDIKANVQLSSISGGTDICSCFALGNPLRPVYRGQLQGAGLGMCVHVFDAQGHAIRESKGELVCSQAFPAMPLGFWGDSDGSRYHGAYFERFANVWTQGDYAELTAQDGFIIYGRSDAVLNPGGVRIGTAEIYRQVECFDEVLEAIAIGQLWHGDERVVMFVVLREGVVLDQRLRDAICDRIRVNASPRHVPALLLQVEDLPRTRSNKLVEVPLRDVIHGRPVRNRDALENPWVLDCIAAMPELQLDQPTRG